MLVLSLALLLACGDKDDDTGGAGDDGGSGEDGGSGDGGSASATADLAELSNGDCPDVSISGTSSFMSADLERDVTMIVPDPLPEGPMPVVFFFHGLMSPDHTPDPAEYMASALGLQALADSNGALIVMPVSPVQSMVGYEFFLWDIQGDSAADLTLYDDLRTCVANEHEVDLDRFVAMGFSGGGLFTTVVLSQRADTLAAAIEMSGGADVDAYIYSDLIARYETPAWPLPVLLQSGGSSDVWPDPKLTIVDFSAATDSLQASLIADGSLVVRCEHSNGHYVTNNGFDLAIDWAMEHAYQQESPWLTEGLGGDEDWCTLYAPE